MILLIHLVTKTIRIRFDCKSRIGTKNVYFFAKRLGEFKVIKDQIVSNLFTFTCEQIFIFSLLLLHFFSTVRFCFWLVQTWSSVDICGPQSNPSNKGNARQGKNQQVQFSLVFFFGSYFWICCYGMRGRGGEGRKVAHKKRNVNNCSPRILPLFLPLAMCVRRTENSLQDDWRGRPGKGAWPGVVPHERATECGALRNTHAHTHTTKKTKTQNTTKSDALNKFSQPINEPVRFFTLPPDFPPFFRKVEKEENSGQVPISEVLKFKCEQGKTKANLILEVFFNFLTI